MIDSQILSEDRRENNKQTKQICPLIHMLKTAGWNVNPLTIITIRVQGDVHKQSPKALEQLKLPPQ